jgi:type VI secretion system protein ImpJ
MLLAPQHFQQSDRYVSALTHFWASTVSSAPWGVLDLDIDQNALMQGVFKLRSSRVVFPDGLVFEHRSDALGALTLNLDDHKSNMRRNAIVIAMQVPMTVDPSVMATEKRYHDSISTLEVDETMAHNTVTIQRKVPNVTLGLYDPASPKYSQIPIAEVRFDGEFYQLGAFHPPAFRIVEQLPFYARLSALATNAREKLIYLSDHLKSTEQGRDVIHNSALFLTFRSLSQIVPALEHALHHGDGPDKIYALILQLSGALSFGLDWAVPPAGNGFDHSNIVHSFEPHLDVIEKSLSRIRKTYQLVDFGQAEGGFSIDLSQHEVSKRVYVVVQSDDPSGAAGAAETVRQALIGSTEVIADLRRKRTLGARRSLLPRDSVERLGLGRDTQVLEVEFDGSLLSARDLLEIRPQNGEGPALSLKLFLSV